MNSNSGQIVDENKMNEKLLIIPLIVASVILALPFVIYSGNDIMTVTSDSMVPTLNPHDIIVVQPSKIEDIQVGDIIAFDSHVEGVGIVVHRATEILDEKGRIFIKTKGDNADKPDRDDPWKVQESDFVGKVTNVIPSVGILFIEPVRYSLVAVIIVSALFLLRDSFTEKKEKT